MNQSINQSACLLIILSIMGASLYAQSPLPDPLPESPSAAHQYYENQGQIIDELGLLHPEIKYYTNDASPQLYLADERISFVTWARGDTSSQDTSYRIDLVFPNCIQEEGECPTLIAEEAGDDHLNYYLGHCPAGITNVAGHKRIIYKDVEYNTDLHFYSNAVGFKSYIVFHPGANPSNFYLHFEGQDSINVLPSGDVDIYLGPMEMIFPQATAYTIDAGGQTHPLSWLPIWIYNGVGEVTLSMGAYNPAHTMVVRIGVAIPSVPPIQNLTWSTYYGANDEADAKDIAVNSQDEPFHLMSITGNTFSHYRGQQSQNKGKTDAVISKFNDEAERRWATYFGGEGADVPERMALDRDSFLFVTGATTDKVGGLNLPVHQASSGFYQGTNNGGSDAFLLELDQDRGYRQWATYFGGAGDDRAYSIDVNAPANLIVIGGTTTSAGTISCSATTDFPLCSKPSAYFQTSNQGGGDGFVVQFGLSDKSLVWSSFFGGSGRDIVYDVLIGNPEANHKANIYICGESKSDIVPTNTTPPLSAPSNGAFPLTADASSPTFFQTNAGGTNEQAFVAWFDSDRQLQWSTFFGGGGGSLSSQFHEMVLTYAGDLYVVGKAFAFQAINSCSASSVGDIPICNRNGISDTWPHTRWDDALFTRFDASGKLLWSTVYGSSAYDCFSFEKGARIALDSRENVYIAGSNGGWITIGLTQAIPVKNTPGAYYQPVNASLVPPADTEFSGDAFVLMFTPDNKLKWGTHFGGKCGCNSTLGILGREYANGLAVYQDQRLYLTGTSYSPQTPYECPSSPNPFCNANLTTAGAYPKSAFITRFELPTLMTAMDESEFAGTLSVFPNPAQGKLNIQLPNSIRGSVEIQLFDQIGREIRQEKHQAKTAILQIEVSELGSGVYYLILTSNDQRYVAKWIK